LFFSTVIFGTDSFDWCCLNIKIGVQREITVGLMRPYQISGLRKCWKNKRLWKKNCWKKGKKNIVVEMFGPPIESFVRSI
jgi:hypothetical protein